MSILITICARGGSKGIPGKNIKLIDGKPLIQYTIDIALKIQKQLKDVFIGLSTDDIKIKEVAEKCGLATTYLRPEELATDTSGKLPVIYHLLNYEQELHKIKFDHVIDLGVSSPMRTSDEVIEGLQMLINDDKAYNLFSVSKARKNPYFNMVEKNEDGYFKLVKKPSTQMLSRQASPKVYEMNASFYIFKQLFFEMDCQSAITDFSMIYEMKNLCFDLDEMEDFLFLEFLVTKQNFKISE